MTQRRATFREDPTEWFCSEQFFHWQTTPFNFNVASMNEVALLQILRTSPEVKRILEHDFDFRPVPIGTKSALFQYTDGVSYEVVGTDGSGGEFVLCEKRDLPSRPL